mmetsp:Transcript_57142/g.156921  ORF Transcript_57142/g.156921 Transcript_57142/m.156921 type:complete len:534 (-) Transcript_57142:86-1687(-)
MSRRPRRTYRRARQRTARQLGPDRLKSHQAALLRPPHRAGTAQLRHEWHASHHAHRGHSPLRILSTNALPTPAVYMHMLESASVHGESHPRAQAAPPLTIATARGFPSSDGRSAPQATGGLRASGDGVRGVARPLRDHLGRALRGVLGKVLLEEGGEVVLRLLELGRVGPRTRRVEQRVGHAGARRRVREAEDRVGLARRLRELSRVDRVDDGARVLEWAALALGAADPPGVEQPRGRLVLLELGGEHRGVLDGVPHEKRLAVTRREGGDRLCDAVLRARHLGCVARDEVVDHLFGRELGDGRQHAVAIACEQDDVGRVAAEGRQLGVGDVLERVGAASVLGDRDVVKVNGAALVIEHDVLDHGAKADGTEDVRLVLLGEGDALGVAAALDVEDSSLGPHVLVIADELAPRVGRERCLTGAAEAEEDGHVAVGSLVGGGVEAELAAQRHLVHHEREDALLHLARVLRPQDDHLRPRVAKALGVAAEVEVDRAGGGHALDVTVGGEAARVEDDHVWHEVVELRVGRVDEHVAHE